MSIKNIALNEQVYRRLASFKKESESFSKAIDRILDEIEGIHTGSDVLARLASMTGLKREEAEAMHDVVAASRRDEKWKRHDLR